MSQAGGLARVRVRSRGEHAWQARELKGVVLLGPRMGNVAGEWAEGQTAQALVAPWGLGLEPSGDQKNQPGRAEHGCDHCSRLLAGE